MPSDRPNVVLVVADDQRFDTVSSLGNDAIETPNFDRLARDGVAFTRAYNMGSDTGAVCVPARAMLHTGRSLFRLEGSRGMETDRSLLGEAFGNAGYRTFGTGKWHNGTDAFDRSFEEGRSIYFGGMDNHWNVPVCDRPIDGAYPDPIPHSIDFGDGRVRPADVIADRYAAGTHSTDLFASAAIDFIEDAARTDRPFFCYLATMEPHDPRTPPGEYLTQYDHEEIDLPPNFAERHPFDNGALGIRDENLAATPRNRDEIRRHIADYFASITHLDHHLGRVLDALDATGERENTIVAFTADHGLAVGQHGLMGKQNLYDHSVHVPLLLSGPGIPTGETRDGLCYQCDLNPTLRDLADVPTQDAPDATSLLPTVRRETDGPRDAVIGGYCDTQRSIRGERYKLVEYAVEGDRHTQLFDLRNDPYETTNLADDPEGADHVNRLRERLDETGKRLGDPMARAF